MQYIYGSYDGPLYIIPAKTLYDPDKIDVPGTGLIISLPLSAGYFAAHLPMYPILIRMASPLFGYPYALLFISLAASCILAILFYEILRRWHITKHPILLTSVFLFLPRFLAVRSVGTPESLFMASLLASLFFFERRQWVWAGIFGAVAAMTKTPGILLILVYALVFGERFLTTRKDSSDAIIPFSAGWLLLIPVGLIVVFSFYWFRYGDFFAYFHTNGVVPMPYPFAAFHTEARWVGSAWLEDIFFYFFLYLFTTVSLIFYSKRSIFYFSLVFTVASLFIEHRDIARYMLPLWPIACIAFERFFTSKRFLFVVLLIIPAVYMYTWNFLLSNMMPIGDWRPFF